MGLLVEPKTVSNEMLTQIGLWSVSNEVSVRYPPLVAVIPRVAKIPSMGVCPLVNVECCGCVSVPWTSVRRLCISSSSNRDVIG